MSAATARSVNRALRRAGIPLTLVSTRQGYQYFVLDAPGRYETRSVCVCYVSDWSVERWVECGSNLLLDMQGETP